MSVLIFHTERFWIKILKVSEVLFVYSCLNQFEQPLLYVGFSFIKQNKQKNTHSFEDRENGYTHCRDGRTRTQSYSILIWSQNRTNKHSLKVLGNSIYEIGLETNCPMWWLLQQLLFAVILSEQTHTVMKAAV